MDLLHEPTSINTMVSQNLSSLLSGEPGRVIMLWRPATLSFASWIRNHTTTVRLFRRLVLIISALLYRRVTLVIKSYPFRLVSLADARVDDATKQEILDDFEGKRPCCLCPGFARKLKGRGGSKLAPALQHISHESYQGCCFNDLVEAFVGWATTMMRAWDWASELFLAA